MRNAMSTYSLLIEATNPPKSAGRDHRFIRLWEDLGQHQPGLEFWNTAGRWVPSGIIAGRVDRQFVRRYRVKKPNDKDHATDGARFENQPEKSK